MHREDRSRPPGDNSPTRVFRTPRLETLLGGVPVEHGTLVAVADVGGAGTGTPPTGLGEALLLEERHFDMEEALDLLVCEDLMCRGADLLETVQA
jgi:hypothetical protein